jgi:hypothetical protein
MLLDIPADLWYAKCKQRRNMETKYTTITDEILNALFYVEHSGGIYEVNTDVIREIVKKYDPQGFESYNPYRNW